MTAITASEASYNTQAATTPSSPDLDVKYSLFNTVVKNAAAAGSWTTLISVAERNGSEFSTWAQALGFAVLTATSNADQAVDLDGLPLESRVRYKISWRKISTVTLRNMISIHEGDTLAFDIVGVGFQAGDKVYWKNSGTTNAQDFGLGPALLRPKGPWLTVKSEQQWALENAAMKRLLTLRDRAQGNTTLVARFTRQIAELKLLLEYRAGLVETDYAQVYSQYEGELTFAIDATTGVPTTTINLVVTRDKPMELASGLTETDETLVINVYADQACTQLLKTSDSYTVVNEQ